MATIQFQKSKKKLWIIFFASDSSAPSRYKDSLKGCLIYLYVLNINFPTSSTHLFLLCSEIWKAKPFELYQWMPCPLCIGFSQQEVQPGDGRLRGTWGQLPSCLHSSSRAFVLTVTFSQIPQTSTAFCPYRSVTSPRVLHFSLLIFLSYAKALLIAFLLNYWLQCAIWFLPVRTWLICLISVYQEKWLFKERWKRKEERGYENSVFLRFILKNEMLFNHTYSKHKQFVVI